MTNLLERLSQWNQHMNGLPRKAWLVAVTLFLTWLLVILAPLCWPFLLAALFSMMLMPLVRFCGRHSKKIRLPRWLVTLAGMILLFGVLGVGLFFLSSRLFREAISLSRSVPNIVNWLGDTAVPYLRGVYQQYSDVLPASAMDMINKSISSMGDSAVSMAGSLSASLTSGAVNAATSIPGILLSIVLTIMGTFYMTADREKIGSFFRRILPADMQKRGLMLKSNLFRSLFGQVKSQITVSLIIMTFLTLSFVLYGVRYGFLFGILIGFLDVLPVIGAGLFLVPWCILSFILGNVQMGIFIGCMYIGTVLIRQIFEPRIVGANLGLYPLATMISMFAGFQLMGVLGLIVGPVLLNLLKVVLEADDVARGVKPEPEPIIKRVARWRKPRPEPGGESEAVAIENVNEKNPPP
jgi:sporulation integral membrane protein YtvI